jgi:hypothetical protein
MNTTPRHPPVVRLAVYDGRDRLGAIVERGDVIEAFDAAGRRLGGFLTRKAAAAAIGELIGCTREARP